MGIQLNEQTYQKLIDENIEALNEYMPEHSLEKKHTVEVLKWSVKQIYHRGEEESSNEASGLHLHSVISRFRFSLTMIGLAFAGIIMMMTFTWTIYWIITGSNFMHDFQKIADKLP